MKNYLLNMKHLMLFFFVLFPILFIAVACQKDNMDCTETTWYRDSDGDGLGNPVISQTACDQPLGYVSDNTDLDDRDSSIRSRLRISSAYLTGNNGTEDCGSPWLDTDDDGICDNADICEGGDDYADSDSDGIPDACDDDPSGGICDGTPGSWVDSDNDGICDSFDECPGFDDYMDADSDGIPDGCDDNSSSAYLTGNDGTEDCGSPWMDTDNDGVCDDADICQGGDDYIDSDSDGIPDACDDNGSSPYLTGNDGTEDCGSPWVDTDNDGVCDNADICQGGDDYSDSDSDGIPDACDDNSTGGGGTPSSAFDEFNPDAVTISFDGDEITIESNGLPNHTSPYWDSSNSLYIDPVVANEQRMSPGAIGQHSYTLTVPASPELATNSSATGLGAIGIAITGAPIFNGEEGPNVALSEDVASGFDYAGGHMGPGGYHYHLEAADSDENTILSFDDDKLVGILQDGFLLYGRKEMDGSYPTDLDESGGHFGITPHSNGEVVYHYHIINEFYIGSYILLFGVDLQGTPNAIM